MEMRRCHNCKRNKLRLVSSFGGDHIEGWECGHCGARKAFGDAHVPKGAWPKAQKWIEKQRIRRKAS